MRFDSRARLPLYLLLAAAAAFAQTPNATGTWVKEDAPYGPWTMELKQVGGNLTGTLRQQGGLPGPSAIFDGAVQGNSLHFQCESPGGARVLTFAGKIRGDEIEFQRSMRIVREETSGNGLFGASAEAHFSVKRVKAVEEGEVTGRGGPVGVNIFSYKAFSVDLSTIADFPGKEKVLDDLRAQIDIIDNAASDPKLKAFLKSVPMRTAPHPSGSADVATYHDGSKVLVLTALRFTHEKPVLLYELMRAWHDQKAPAGFANPDIQRLFEQAKSGGKFPSGSHMLTDSSAYFAMVSSVYLNGRAARDPNTRQELKEKQPDCYAWLLKQFGPR